MRELKESHATDRGRNKWKRRQVFFSLLSTTHMSNPYLFSWWGMTHSVVHCGGGVGAIASNVGSYWGSFISTSTKNRRISSLTGNLIWKYRRLLIKSRAKLFSFDNFQIGQEVKDHRGRTFFGVLQGHKRVCAQGPRIQRH